VPHHAPKLLILGRDGVLNVYREDHVKAPQEWQAIPGALEALARLNHAGWHAVVATNQAGIGSGMLDMASINAVHAHMHRQLMGAGARVDAVFFCPHTPQEGCDCRKPLPGLMRDIGRRYGASLAEVPVVSDSLRDLQAAAAAGCPPHLVRTGRAQALDEPALARIAQQVPQARIHADLAAFADWLLSQGAPAGAARE
jgi:D-glycero-D-manno-heptose 1,7-bisphosphate phosphatase